MRFMSGETYSEAVQRKRYKYRKCAWRAAAKAGKWFTVKLNGYGRYCVVPMTQGEKERAQRDISFNQIIREVYSEPIKNLLNEPSSLYRRLA